MEHIMADASLLNTYNTIKKENTDLILMMENITNSFMPQAFSKEVDLSYFVEPGSEAYFTSYPCDSVKLKQVFINLVKNAFEATIPGNYIHIDMKHLPGDTNTPSKLCFKISNNGDPIPDDLIDNIFVPFISYKTGGTGVGLALVKKVVDLHFGSISVDSNKALTVFTIELPL
jgi:signal transduction histidine kinase